MSQDPSKSNKFFNLLKPSKILGESTPAVSRSIAKAPFPQIRSPSIGSMPSMTQQELPLSEEQIDTATGWVRTLGYRDIPRPPLRYLRILRETCQRYDDGRLNQVLVDQMNEANMREELEAFLEECNAEELLRIVPRTLSGQGTPSTVPMIKKRSSGDRTIAEIPSGVTQADFQQQLAQTFQEASSTLDFRPAHDTMRDPLPAPRPSYGTWHNLATGTQGPLFLTSEDQGSSGPADVRGPQEAIENRRQVDHDSESVDGVRATAAAAPLADDDRGPLIDATAAADQGPAFHPHLPRERERHRQRRGRGGPPPVGRRDGDYGIPPPNVPNPAHDPGPMRQNHYPAPAFAAAIPLPQPGQPPPLTREDIQLALSRENKLRIRDPEPFTGKDRRRWKPFLTECLMTFAAKPHTHGGDRAKVLFAATYLTELAQKHYITLLQYQPNHPALYRWADFVQEFGNMFGNLNAKLEAERALSRIKMKDHENFHHHLTRFEVHAYESGWNYDALRYALQRSLPRRLKNALATMEHRPTSYQDLRQLLSNLDQSYWESLADEEEDQARGQRQAQRADASNRANNRGQPNDATPRASSSRPTNVRPTGPRPSGSTQNNTGPTISAEERDRRRREGLCIRCTAKWSVGHVCANRQTTARAAVVLGDDDDDGSDDNEGDPPSDEEESSPEENLGAIQELPGEV